MGGITVLYISLMGLVCADLVPVFNRLPSGQIQVVVPGIPGLRAVALTLKGSETEHSADIKNNAVEGRWKTTVPDVTKDDDQSVNYVITYTLKEDQHQIEGSAYLDNVKSLAGPVTPRYLKRRATTVLHDDFTSGSIDVTKWRHAVTGYGGGNHEFNMYTPEAVNSYVKNNMLYIKPTLTVDHFGANFLTNGDLNVSAIWGECISIGNRGCHLSGSSGEIPPVMSAMLMSKASIRYGRVTIDAKLPKGDWLWPAFWLLPTEKHYGGWPKSGEIDIMESRGNAHYHDRWHPNLSMGRDYTHAAIHYGSNWNNPHKRFKNGAYRIPSTTFTDTFHSYWMDWTADYIKIGVDEYTVMALDTPAEGYWQKSQLQGDNIWASGGKDAPFDRPFFLILNVAVGGGWFWERLVNSPYLQPWQSRATKADQFRQFWQARHLWEPTWHTENAAMKVRSITMEQY